MIHLSRSYPWTFAYLAVWVLIVAAVGVLL